MVKRIIIILSLILIIITSILGVRTIKKIKMKNEVEKSSTVFNEQNEIYITKDGENGAIEYRSDTMTININPIKKTNPNIEMWEILIKINDGSQIKSAFAGDEFNLKNRETTSFMAMNNNAVLAINGAAYGFNKSSYVIRDGIVYRDTRLDCDPLVIQSDGDFRIYDEQYTGEELIAKGAMHTYDFGPDLIRKGEIVDYGDTWYKNDLSPRTAIGQCAPLEYVILVVDGRSDESVGMSLYDVATELKNRGCYWGYNLDGGGSTTLYFNGKVLNNPCDWYGERPISDILYFVD